MTIAAPARTAAAGLRWPAVKLAPAARQADGREQNGLNSVPRRDARRMPNGDPPAATLWGTGAGE
jgi:hypothetical protein